MATLLVRDIPDQLYERLHKLAVAHKRSLSAQVTIMLDQAVQNEEVRVRRHNALENIRRRRWTLPPGAPDSTQMLRKLRGYDD